MMIKTELSWLSSIAVVPVKLAPPKLRAIKVAIFTPNFHIAKCTLAAEPQLIFLNNNIYILCKYV